MSSAISATLASLSRRWGALRAARAEAAAAREFWDAGAPGEPEDRWWGSQPLVRRAINRRVTGDPHRWPMEWFADRYVPTPLPVGLSIGCGTGRLERDVLMKGVCERMEGVDFSPEAITEARRGAEEEGLSRRLRYRVEDIHAMRLPREAYDIVFFHGSLHHIRNVEGALEQVRDALKPGGLIFVDEYMGPSRSEWTDAMWGFARSAFDALREELKNRPELAIPLPMDDPSESVRSSAILPACRRLFEILEDRPYGGNVLWFVFPCLDMARLREDATGVLSRLIALEDHLLERGWVESYFRVVVGRKEVTGER